MDCEEAREKRQHDMVSPTAMKSLNLFWLHTAPTLLLVGTQKLN